MRFGYDGAAWDGWARQPGHTTVEGELRAGLLRHHIARGPDVGRLEVASRTDRGVSARGNALALDSELGAVPLLRALNGISPRMFFTASREIDDGYRVRAAVRRHYRYFDSPGSGSAAARAAAARLFRGTVDVRSFGRGLPTDRCTYRAVDSVTVRESARGLRIDVFARSYVWGMVRKIVGAIHEVDAGRLPLDELRRALAGELRLTLPMAAPEPLVLWEVEYREPWTHRWAGPNRHQLRWWSDERLSLDRRRRVLEGLTPGPGRPGSSALR